MSAVVRRKAHALALSALAVSVVACGADVETRGEGTERVSVDERPIHAGEPSAQAVGLREQDTLAIGAIESGFGQLVKSIAWELGCPPNAISPHVERTHRPFEPKPSLH